MIDCLPLSLARANIGHHWKMFLAAISVLVLSGCLIYVAIGISMSNVRSLSAYERSLDADLFIVKEKSKGAKRGRYAAFPTAVMFEVENYAEVEQVERFVKPGQILNLQNGDEHVRLFAKILPREAKGMRVPKAFNKENRQLLSVPGNIFIGRYSASKHDLKIGQQLQELNYGSTITVVGILDSELGRSSGGFRGNNFLTQDTLDALGVNKGVPYAMGTKTLMVKLKKGVELEPARARMSHYLKKHGLTVIVPQKYQQNVSLDFILENKEFQGFLFLGVLAILIPLFIVVQTLRSAILAQKVQFATLRALGIPQFRLVKIAMEQAFWVGILGTTLSFCLMLIIRWKLSDFDILMYVSKTIIIRVSLAIMSASLIAGVISLLAIFKTRPQELLR